MLKPTIEESLEVLKKHGFRVPSMHSGANVVVAVKSYEKPFEYTHEGITILVTWQAVQFDRPEGAKTEKVGSWCVDFNTEQS